MKALLIEVFKKQDCIQFDEILCVGTQNDLYAETIKAFLSPILVLPSKCNSFVLINIPSCVSNVTGSHNKKLHSFVSGRL